MHVATSAEGLVEGITEQQQRLLNLQRIDSGWHACDISAFPVLMQVQQPSDELVALQRDIVQAQTSGADLQRP
jgi:hypothetical protein